ncbi:MAG: hypothetical protein ABIE07_09235 [Candidatus Zixiibacteriota bacterium]
MKRTFLIISIGLMIISSSLWGQTNLTAPVSDTPPTIDGVIGGTEWQDAQTYNLTFHSNVDQTTVDAPVYLLNDGTFLYCASTVPFPSAPTAYFGIYIDGDHSHSFNGIMSEPHTDLGYNKAGTNSPLYSIYNAYWAERPPCGVVQSDAVTPPSGAEHAFSGTGEISYEFKIPLSDMTVSPGETVGIHFMFSPGGVGYMYPSADYCDIASWPDLYIEEGGSPNPDQITLVGEYTDKPAYDLKVRGNIAYVNSFTEFYTLDISDPANPLLLGTYNPGVPYIYNVSLIGNYAYLGENLSGFEVIDISDPSSPTKVGPSYHPPDVAKDFVFANGYAFLANRAGGVRVYDISDPASPVYITSYSASAWATSLAVSGNYLYVGIEHSPYGIDIFDISSPLTQTKVASLSGSNSVHEITASGNYVYHSGFSFNVVDVSNPSDPVRLGSGFPTHGDPWGIAISGNMAFLGERSYGL